MKELVLKHVLINAIKYRGKAQTQAVLGKVLAEKPELKSKIQSVRKLIERTVKRVNSLSLEEQRKRLSKLGVEIKKVVKRFELPPLPHAKVGKVVTAFPPEPSKFPHLGHAKCAHLNHLYAKKYKGTFICRLEDTNPRVCEKKYYDAILNGLKWLGIKPDRIDYTSDHLKEFYTAAEKLIQKNAAYVCTCKPSIIRRNRKLMQECSCRARSTAQNLELWKRMFDEFKEGQAVVRLKINMHHPNAAMRDPAILRIVDYPHPRTGKRYRIWPMYDFAAALLDSWEHVTHRIRSKEFEMRTELQQHIQRTLGLPSPWIDVTGRLNLEGVPTSGRVIRDLIKKGKLRDWDDPRLTTLLALRRRGFLPEAIKEFLLRTGVSKAEATLTWDILEAINRKFVDPLANRYFCIIDPVKIEIQGIKVKEVEVALHPEFPRRGKRKIPVDVKEVYVERNDFNRFKGKEVGLMYFCTVKLGKKAKFVSKQIKIETPKIHWVSKPLQVKLVLSDGKVKDALAEASVKKLRVGTRIQMPRVGFCILDQVKPEIVFYFTHP